MGQTKNVFRLLLLTFGMFGFGFALVPLYDIFCDITGLNGKVSGPTFVSYDEELQTRSMKVTFVTLNNTTLEPMVAQAIPSVSPGRGAKYFHKTECFCFEQQYLAAGESITIPVKFIIDPEIPDDISSLALGYTLFDVTEQFAYK